MRKKLLYSILLMSVSLFCACGTDNPQQDTATTDTSVEFQNPDVQAENSTMSTEETVAGENSLVENQSALPASLAALETMDWTELTCYADEETSLRNSNHLNNEYLTYDENGQIYFSYMDNSGIFVSDYNGENMRQVSEDKASMLQVDGNWLYYRIEPESGIKRLNLETGEEEWVHEEPCGEFMIVDGKVYINEAEGFCVTELDGSNKEIIKESEIEMTAYVTANEFWIGNYVAGLDASTFFKGYLIGFNENDKELYYITEGVNYPLLAGNFLSVFDKYGALHVWNLETGEDTNLKVYEQRPVSDGNTLYYVDRKESVSFFYRWDGKEAEKFLTVETSNVEYLYLTPQALYWIQSLYRDDKFVTELWYYDLETEETGKIY